MQPESRRNEVLGWVKQGVRDFSISRAAVEWGIPVPRDPKQTVYVWFDALNGYLSGGWGASRERSLLCAEARGVPGTLLSRQRTALAWESLPAGAALAYGARPPAASMANTLCRAAA